MRELEASLQQFGEFLLKAQLARPQTAPYFVRWVRRFLSRPASDEPLADQVRGFCEELERNGGSEDWQVRQADQALRIYFVNFLKRTEWHQRPASTVVDKQGSTSRLAALDLLRTRLRTRHYSYRTECTYVDWVRRFLNYAAQQQGTPQARVTPEVMRDYFAHLAVHRHVSASTQNQACCAILFLCREVLGVDVENVSPGVRAKRGERLPVVLSMPETMALLEVMSGTPRLMATLIYGGGLRVTECCELRIKDIDFDQGLVFVRSGKGDKDRSTLLAEVGRDDLRAHHVDAVQQQMRGEADLGEHRDMLNNRRLQHGPPGCGLDVGCAPGRLGSYRRGWSGCRHGYLPAVARGAEAVAGIENGGQHRVVVWNGKDLPGGLPDLVREQPGSPKHRDDFDAVAGKPVDDAIGIDHNFANDRIVSLGHYAP